MAVSSAGTAVEVRVRQKFINPDNLKAAGILTNILEVRKEGHEYIITFDKRPQQAEIDLLTKLIQNGIWEAVAS
jgi:hypothetical protein